eukprot:c43395_g1_i1 orf=269-472(+)
MRKSVTLAWLISTRKIGLDQSANQKMAPPCTNKEDKLDKTNFAHCKLTMRIWFQQKGLRDIVNGNEE